MAWHGRVGFNYDMETSGQVYNTERERERERERQKDRQTHRETDRQTDRQSDGNMRATELSTPPFASGDN